MSSSASGRRASRTVLEEGPGLLVEIEEESCARFRPAMEMSLLAIKPEGVRVVVEEEAACSAARERSRRALALRRFSSWSFS